MATLFDYAGSLDRMGGDEQLFCEMVGFFVADSPIWLEQIRDGLNRGDAKLVHRSAHTLKGLAANFGARQAVIAASRVEQLSQPSSHLGDANEAFPILQAAIGDLRAALAPYYQPPDVAAR